MIGGPGRLLTGRRAPWQHPEHGNVWERPTVDDVAELLRERLRLRRAVVLPKAAAVVLLDHLDALADDRPPPDVHAG
jgi:hypothetical protein